MALVNNQQKQTKNISTDGIEILDLYRKGDLKKLAQCDLSTTVDSDGNTIVHIIATNLDKNAFEKLINFNDKCILPILINKPNNQLDCPLHKALQSINASDRDDYSIISFMINKLNADPDIPNKDNWVIAKDMNTTSDNNTEQNRPQSKSQNKSQNESQKISFIRKLTDKYVPMSGGSNNYMGHRLIKSASETSASDTTMTKFKRNFSSGSADLFTESGKNDTFKIKSNKHKTFTLSDLTTLSQDRPKKDPEVTARYNEILKKIMEFLNLDEDKAKMYRSIIKLYLEKNNPELKGAANDALKIKEMEKIVENKKKLTEYWEKKVSPEADAIKAHMAEQAKLGEERKKHATGSKDKSKDKDTKSKQDKPKPKSKKKAKSDSDIDTPQFLSISGGSDSDDVDDSSNSTDSDDAEKYLDTITTSDRPKSNSDINKRYYNVLEKIKEYMGVTKENDADARERRTIIKLYLQKTDMDLKNPELSGANKAILKIEKLEKIVSDKKSFENYWNNVISAKEKEAIRSYMKGQAEKNEKMRKDTTSSIPSVSTTTTTTTTTSSDSDDKPKKKTVAKKVTVDKKTTVTKKPTKKTKVVENGYIRSDELIFSTEDY